QVSNPQQITMDGVGDLYFASASNTGFVEALNGGGFRICQNPAYGFPYGIGVDNFGNVYLGANNSQVITKVLACTTLAPNVRRGGIVSSKSEGFTSTPTSTPSVTPTDTPTPMARSYEFLVVAPNLSTGGQPVNFQVDLEQPSRIDLVLFSLAGE